MIRIVSEDLLSDTVWNRRTFGPTEFDGCVHPWNQTVEYI